MKNNFLTRQFYLVGLIVVQAICALVFCYDVASDFIEDGSIQSVHAWIELIAAMAMIGAILFEANSLRKLLNDHIRMERSLLIAKGKMQNVIDTYFADWGLTPAEMDVAILAIKGFSINEISNLRQAQEGTTKSQLTSIYRKAGVKGRNQLGSLLIEDLMGTPL